MSDEDPGGGVEEGQGEQEVLQAVEKGEAAVLSPHPSPLLAVLSSPNPGISSVRMTEGGIICLRGRILLVGRPDPRQW